MFGILGVLAALMGLAVAVGAVLLVLAILVSPLVLLVLLIRAGRARAGVKRSRVPIVLAGIATAICIIAVLQFGRHTHFSFHYVWPHYFWPDFGRKPPATTSV